MKTAFIITAAALALGAPAAAQSQFAAALDVEPGQFTQAELIQLDRAYEENDMARVNFILSGGSNLDAATIERRGVELAIDRAIEEGDAAQARGLAAARLAELSDTTLSSRGEEVIPGWLQTVAADLGVDAADFTRGELLALARYQEEGDVAAVNGLISRAAN